jgi:hypothetical protein
MAEWLPPEPGWMRLNTDTAFQKEDNKGATACLLRDHRGDVKLAQALWYDSNFDVCTVEAFACRDGLKLAVDHGVQRVLLEN